MPERHSRMVLMMFLVWRAISRICYKTSGVWENVDCFISAASNSLRVTLSQYLLSLSFQREHTGSKQMQQENRQLGKQVFWQIANKLVCVYEWMSHAAYFQQCQCSLISCACRLIKLWLALCLWCITSSNSSILYSNRPVGWNVS